MEKTWCQGEDNVFDIILGDIHCQSKILIFIPMTPMTFFHIVKLQYKKKKVDVEATF